MVEIEEAPITVEKVVEVPAKPAWPSWANEVIAVFLAAPAILAFVDPERTTAGFDVLAGAPTWYLTSLGIVVAAILGVKSLGPMLKR